MDTPDELICPITLEIMTDPVICDDGYTYERSAIMSIHKSPMTREAIKTKLPNRALKIVIDKFLSQKEQTKETEKEQITQTEQTKQTENYIYKQYLQIEYDRDYKQYLEEKKERFIMWSKYEEDQKQDRLNKKYSKN